MKTIAVRVLSQTMPPEPMLEHAIRLPAYELYAQRGMVQGHAGDDWLAAESDASIWPLATLRLEPEIEALKQINALGLEGTRSPERRHG